MKRTLVFLALVAAGCGGSSKPGGAAGGSGGNGGGGGSGVGGVGGVNGVAVLSNDSMYSSTMLSLADAAGATLTRDDCLDSGSASSLSQALSGDVVLGGPVPNGDVLLIDRTNGALDWIKPGACTVDAQMALATFYANPQAYVQLSDHKAYVTLEKANPTGGSAAGNDQGDDLLIIDPAAQTVTGHVDLSAYAGTSGAGTILPTPEGALLAGGKVWVALDEAADGFAAFTDGAIVAVDPASDSVTASLTLPGYRDCGDLDYDAASQTLLVTCKGDFTLAMADYVAGSAVILVDVSGGTPVIAKTIAASALNDWPIGGARFAGSDLVIAETYGDFVNGTVNDGLWAIDPHAGSAANIAFDAVAGDFGSFTYLAAAKLLLVTDGNAQKPAIRVYDAGNAAQISEKSRFDADPKAGLLPHVVGLY